jgi:Ni2+-binding GTPase involved in maturation of urease and hydrogenase
LIWISRTNSQQAPEALLLESLERLIVENVGNLICPSEFQLGTPEHVARLNV